MELDSELIEREFEKFFNPLYGSDALITGKSCRAFSVHIAKLARSHEREACAKECEKLAEHFGRDLQDGEAAKSLLQIQQMSLANGAFFCSDAIRARGDTPCN